MTVSGTAGSVVTVNNEATFVLTLKNPCVDNDFVHLTDIGTLPTHQYILYQTGPEFQTITHTESSIVVTSSENQNLCGFLSYKVKFDDVEGID